MTMITPSYLGETIEYSSLHACRSTLEDPTGEPRATSSSSNGVVGSQLPTGDGDVSEPPPLGPDTGDEYFIAAGSGSHHTIFPGVEICTVAGRRMMLSVVTFEPGSAVAAHSHHHEQMGILISGRLEFTIGGVTRVLGPGDFWRIPGGVMHNVTAIDGPAVALDCFHPIREDYL